MATTTSTSTPTTFTPGGAEGPPAPSVPAAPVPNPTNINRAPANPPAQPTQEEMAARVPNPNTENLSGPPIPPAEQEILEMTEAALQNSPPGDPAEGLEQIAATTTEEPPSDSSERIQTPEELREQRRMAIIKELVGEWEAKNGSMYRPLSEHEIENNKNMARLWGMEWDGRTTRMTDAASEFFFDFSNNGRYGIPNRAERILTKRFPEYAQMQSPNQDPTIEVASPQEVHLIENSNQSAILQASADTAEAQAPPLENDSSPATSGDDTQPAARTYEETPSEKITADQIKDRLGKELATKELPTAQDLEQRRQKLDQRPYLGFTDLRDVVLGGEHPRGLTWIPTKAVAGTSHGKWSEDFDERKGRVAEVAKEIIKGSQGDTQEIEHVFHPDTSSKAIKMTEISGPQGPIYYVDDGTHRTKSAMILGIEEIPVAVRKITYPLEEVAASQAEIDHWQTLIDRGLVVGRIEPFTSSQSGRTGQKLIVESEALTWIRAINVGKISRAYKSVYPESLNTLSFNGQDIPSVILFDEVAMNYYMAGRWDEWLKKFGDLPRDKNGRVMHSSPQDKISSG